jgi:hypothetical protein
MSSPWTVPNFNLRLSPFDAERNLANCTLDDRASCPHTTPAQLTAEEIATIGSMVQDASFRHMSLRALALHAQRMGRVFAAFSTWARLVRNRGWLRPRRRLYPAKPREGIRASCPNEYWHLDVSAPCRPCRIPLQMPAGSRPTAAMPSRMPDGVEGSFDPNGCGFTFRTPDRAQRGRCPGHLRFLSFQRRQG